MGVTGLWKLIEQSGTPVPLETLENKVLAVDISIWLHQSVKGFQDSSGAALPHAHLLGLYHRICKLLYYRIRPVFVFDGGIPYLKTETMRKRMASKNSYRAEANRLQKLLAQSLEREKLIQHALGEPSTSTAVVSPHKDRLGRADKDDMFILPPIPESELDKTSSSLDQSTSSVEECTQKTYNVNLQTIDVTSKHFLSLPADVRHEILTDIKSMRKESSWGRLHELPEESNEFSGFQMQRLLKRRQVQKSLETAEQEMGGKSMTFGEIEKLLQEDGIVEADAFKTNRLLSDENTRYLHVRNLNKAMREEAKKMSLVKEELEEEEEESPAKRKRIGEDIVFDVDDEEDDDTQKMKDELEDEDEQLQRAIQMSLEDCQIVAGPSTANEVVPFIEMKTEPATEDDSANVAEDSSSDVSSNADSDFIEVPEAESDTSLTLPSQISFELNIAASPDPSTDFRHSDLKLFVGKPADALEVVIDPEHKPLPHEDLFADIFKTEDTLNTEHTLKTGDNNYKMKANVKETSFDSIETDNGCSDSNMFKIYPSVKKPSPSNLDSILSKLNAEMDSLVKQDLHLFGQTDTIVSKEETTAKDIVIEGEPNKPESQITQTEETKNVNQSVYALSPDRDIIEIDSDADDVPSVPKIMKQTDIAQFVQVTPTKKASVERPTDTTPPSKVASPFFRKKTPSSSKVNPSESKSPSPKKSKKSLFPDILKPHPEKPTQPKSREEILQEVATELRDQVGVGELKEMAQESHQNTRDLLMERNKQDRMGTSITDRMSADCKQLLRIFGVPFVVAPMEAEAQCAYLDAACLTDGTITDDSDIWLFGGRTVYKHFFNQTKTVQEFRSESVKRLFNVERESLIQMAMLVGSDYTTGVTGIGMVTALEILSSFPSTPNKNNGGNIEQELLAKLRKFKEWLTNNKIGTNVRLRTKLKNVALADEFPSIQVVQSYLYPEVNDKLQPFSWRPPDAETLREFAKTTFGWTFSKTDETLLPVLKRTLEKKSQLSIRNYFSSQGVIDRKEVTVSKRVRKAIDQMANAGEENVEEEKSEAKQSEKPKRGRKPKATKTPLESKPDTEKEKPTKRSGRVPREQASTSSAASKSPLKAARIPDFQPPIRQRELAAAQQEKVKAEAIAMFKESKKRNAKKK